MNRPEEALHRQVARVLAVYEARGLLAFCHVPNGGKRTRAEAGVFKALGVRPGVPDLLVWALVRGQPRSFALELKAPKGRLTESQAEWSDRLGRLGVAVHVVRDLDGLDAALAAEGVPILLRRSA